MSQFYYRLCQEKKTIFFLFSKLYFVIMVQLFIIYNYKICKRGKPTPGHKYIHGSYSQTSFGNSLIFSDSSEILKLCLTHDFTQFLERKYKIWKGESEIYYTCSLSCWYIQFLCYIHWEIALGQWAKRGSN